MFTLCIKFSTIFPISRFVLDEKFQQNTQVYCGIDR